MGKFKFISIIMIIIMVVTGCSNVNNSSLDKVYELIDDEEYDEAEAMLEELLEEEENFDSLFALFEIHIEDNNMKDADKDLEAIAENIIDNYEEDDKEIKNAIKDLVKAIELIREEEDVGKWLDEFLEEEDMVALDLKISTYGSAVADAGDVSSDSDSPVEREETVDSPVIIEEIVDSPVIIEETMDSPVEIEETVDSQDDQIIVEDDITGGFEIIIHDTLASLELKLGTDYEVDTTFDDYDYIVYSDYFSLPYYMGFPKGGVNYENKLVSLIIDFESGGYWLKGHPYNDLTYEVYLSSYSDDYYGMMYDEVEDVLLFEDDEFTYSIVYLYGVPAYMFVNVK